jgi:hypothetical protein
MTNTLLTGAPRLQVKPAYIQWNNGAAALFFDAVTSEDHERGADISDYAVEQGAVVVDNVRPLPNKLTLEAFVSNSPIDSPDGQIQPLTILVDPPIDPLSFPRPQSVTASTLQFTGVLDYVATTFSTLTSLRDTATLLTITTPRAYYTNMIVEKISLHRDATTGTSGKFSIEFREIRIVTSKVVAAPTPTILTSTPTATQGTKTTTPADTHKESAWKAAGAKAGHDLASNTTITPGTP